MQHPHRAGNKGLTMGFGLTLVATVAHNFFSSCLQLAGNVEDNVIEEAPMLPPIETMGDQIIEDPLTDLNQIPALQNPSSSSNEDEEVDGFLMITGVSSNPLGDMPQ